MKLKKDSPKGKVKREKSRKEVIILETIGILLFVLSFVSILILVFLGRGDGNFRYGLPFIIAFFVLCISSVAVLIYVFPDAVVHDLHRNVDKAVDAAIGKLERMREKTRCVCLILFMYKNNPTKNDKEQLRTRCAYTLTDENVLPDSEGVNVVPVLVDNATGEGTFLSKRRGISIYAHGCRLLKRYIQ